MKNQQVVNRVFPYCLKLFRSKKKVRDAFLLHHYNNCKMNYISYIDAKTFEQFQLLSYAAKRK